MSDETNPDVAGQPNPVDLEDANPQGSVGPETREADALNAEESAELTQERIQQLLENERLLKEANITDPKAFYADYTRKSQRASELEQAAQQWEMERQQYQQAVQGFMGQRQAQADPEQAAWSEYQTRLQEYDQEGALEAHRRWADARDRRVKNETLREVFAAQQVQQTLQDLSYLGDTNPERMARDRQRMTDRDWAEAQLLLEARRRGDLVDRETRYRQSEEARRAKAARIDSFLGDGSSGHAPGSADRQTRKPIDLHEFFAMAPAARKAKYGFTQLPT